MEKGRQQAGFALQAVNGRPAVVGEGPGHLWMLLLNEGCPRVPNRMCGTQTPPTIYIFSAAMHDLKDH